MSIVLETTIGDLTIDLFTDERPRTCMNFLKLCKSKYYNLNILFSVQRDFIAQTGDPTGTGRGGDSIFEQLYGKQARYYEGEKMPPMKHVNRGTVSMVSCGDHMFGSQFLITLGECLDSLDGEHLVFGEVVDGDDVLARLNSVLTDDSHRPYQDVRITHTVVLQDPFPDPEGLKTPSSPIPTQEMLDSNYIGAEETLEEDDNKTETQLKEELEEKEAKARATILEIVGDLPDADVAPPENVLFVCKLNPVTSSDDLEIIFSRFGKVVSCEVIKDRVTGNSLQYAFIEFQEQKSCEDAYFKMDNVLIDDRRIHVDFSQSVSKIQYKGKGRIEYFDDDGKKIDSKEGNKTFNPNKPSTNKKNYDRSKNDKNIGQSKSSQSTNPDEGRYGGRKDRDYTYNRDDRRSNRHEEHRERNHRNEDHRDVNRRNEDHRDRSHRNGDSRDRSHRKVDHQDRSQRNDDHRDRSYRNNDSRDKNYRNDDHRDRNYRNDGYSDKNNDRDRHQRNDESENRNQRYNSNNDRSKHKNNDDSERRTKSYDKYSESKYQDDNELGDLINSKESRKKVLKQLKQELKKKSPSESESSDDYERKKKKKHKRKNSSDSDSEPKKKKKKHYDDDSSSSDSPKRKKNKKHKKKKKKKKQKKYSSSSDSDSD